MAKLDDTNTTGFYSEQITLSAANGFEVGKSYAIYMTATVQGTLGGQTLNFKIIAARSRDAHRPRPRSLMRCGTRRGRATSRAEASAKASRQCRAMSPARLQA